MTPLQAERLKARIARRWPEATDLQVAPDEEGAKVSMMIEDRLQLLDVSDGGPLLDFLLSRPVPGG